MKLGKQRMISAALVMALTVGSISGAGVAQAAKKAALKAKSMTLFVKKSKKIAIKNKSAKKKYTFKSSKASVAKVSKAGKVTGVKAGKAKISVYEENKKKPKKKKKIGTCSVVVKAKQDNTQKKATAVPAVTTAPGSAAPSVTAPAATAPSATAPSATAVPTEPAATAKPTIVPAYNTTTVDFDGSTSKVVESEITVPLTEAMLYGGICKISADFTQETGSEQELAVGYEGEYLNFTLNGAYIKDKSVDPMSDSTTFSCPSGETVHQEFSFEVPKYSYDFNLKLSGPSGVNFKVDNVTVQAMPFEDADYAGMVEASTRSTGNNARIKKAIEKARAGEDVTIAYLGGSITEGFAASETDNGDCYAEESYNQFKYNYGAGDGSNVHFINAGMSGTPSRLGIIRYERDVLAQMKHGQYPDILFIDFAVNDGGDCAEQYESIIRTALEQGSAVVLMFVLYNNGNGREDLYEEFGGYYELAMVSPGSGMESAKKSAFDHWFYWPDGHPDVGGHRYMADCISRMFRAVDEEETKTDNNTVTKKPVEGKNFVGMKTLESSTDISKIDAVKSIELGGFSVLKDSAQPTLQYIKNGVEKLPWFPDVWAHTSSSGSDSFKAEIKCNSILVAYKQAGSGFGKAECYVDGEYVGDLDKSNGGWNNAMVFTALSESTVLDHTLEIKMKEGDEKKPFTIYAIGYADSGEEAVYPD